MSMITLPKKSISTSLVERGRQILHEEGFLSFFKHAVSFLLYMLFAYRRYYLYEYNFSAFVDMPNIPCQVHNVAIKPIFVPMTLEEFEELTGQGFDFRSHPNAQNYEKGLNNGVIVFYAFTGDELLFMTGVALGKRGTYCDYPLSDDGRTVIMGYTETAIKYRQKGVFSYVYFNVCRYLGEQGFSKGLALAQDVTIASNRVHQKLGAKLLCKTYSVRLLRRFSFTWVKPISKSSVMQ